MLVYPSDLIPALISYPCIFVKIYIVFLFPVSWINMHFTTRTGHVSIVCMIIQFVFKIALFMTTNTSI